MENKACGRGRGRGRCKPKEEEVIEVEAPPEREKNEKASEDQTEDLASSLKGLSLVTTCTSEASEHKERGGAGSLPCSSKSVVPVPHHDPSSGAACLNLLNEAEKKEDFFPLPATKSGAAHEFRLDCKISPAPIPAHFFCSVCGLPAGYDCKTCFSFGHAMCRLCQEELKIVKCPYITGNSDGTEMCGEWLVNPKPSKFRKYMFDNIIVGCQNRSEGCKFEGPWEKVKKHQNNCKYSSSEQK